MKLLKQVYALHHQKANALLTEATLHANPAIWLYINNLRTPMFMLEATSRLCEKIHDDAPCFLKMKEDYKAVEDAIGALDYYSAALKGFETKDTIPKTANQYLAEKVTEKTAALTNLLEKEGWLTGKKLSEIEQQLEAVDFRKDAKELEKIAKFYVKGIEKTIEVAYETNFVFGHIEEVHEIRRRVRWLSIYPQALAGIFRFAETDAKPTPQMEKYMTDAVKKSPFNVIPTTLSIENPILLSKNHFLTMSWLIAELGDLKDNGLSIELLKEALQNTASLDDAAAYAEAYKVLGQKQIPLDSLITKSQNVLKTYFDEGHLTKLLVV
jgi:hypothetical protein